MPGGLSTLEPSVTDFPSMANSFSLVVGVAVAVSSITGMQRWTSGTHTVILRPACAEVSMVSCDFDSITTSLSMHSLPE